RVVQMQVLLPGAYAGAAPELVAEAGPAAAALHAERLQAEPLLVGERAQRLQRRAPRAGDAADQGQRLGVDLLRLREPQPAAVEHEAARRRAFAQLAVVGRAELLHEPRL